MVNLKKDGTFTAPSPKPVSLAGARSTGRPGRVAAVFKSWSFRSLIRTASWAMARKEVVA
jgi:hypothetical protein